MADIIVNKDPGQYAVGQTITVTFPPNTRRAIITNGDRTPVLTEILAYDVGPIPPGTADVERPFLAVTQDGRGNVVYDGGFPKFYNVRIADANGSAYPPTLPTTLDRLPPSAEYMLNALKFIANPRKVAQGNRKILFLNNTPRNAQYNVLKSHYKPDPLQNNEGNNGFRDTFDAVTAIGGWTPVYWDLTTQGSSKLDLTVTQLDEYVAVVFLASAGGLTPTVSNITDDLASNLSIYRQAGNGVFIITDHCGGNYTSIADAIANGSMFGPDATKVAQYYGTYFSGDVERSPVSVGEIRRQIGYPGPPENHPLLDGMSDSEFIYAGGSESLVIPESVDANLVDPNEVWSTDLNTPGTYRINVLVQLDDGTIITRPLRYVIINPGDLSIKDSFGRVVTNTSQTYKPMVDYSLDTTATNVQTVTGELLLNDMLVGFFTTSIVDGKVNTVYQPLGGPDVPIPLKNGDVFKFATKIPFEYVIPVTINIPNPEPYFNVSTGVSTFSKLIVSHPYFTNVNLDRTFRDLIAFTDKCYTTARSIGTTILGQWWKVMGKSRLPFTASEPLPLTVGVYANDTIWEATKPEFANVGTAVIIANNNNVYYWNDVLMVWALHVNKASTIFTLGRRVINTLDNTNWVVQNGSTIKVLS